MIVEEKFKSVIGYEGHYEVSDLGNVKSLKWGMNRILKPSLTNKGYLQVQFRLNGKSKSRQIQQIVAESFLGHVPCGMKLVVDHKNLCKTDNRIDNLQIITNRENCNRRHLKSSSEYIGVCWNKNLNKWSSSIRIKGKNKHLGNFSSELEASNYYQDALFSICKNLPIETSTKKKTSKYKGVSFYVKTNQWEVKITNRGKREYLGRFDTEAEAHDVYELALSEINNQN